MQRCFINAAADFTKPQVKLDFLLADNIALCQQAKRLLLIIDHQQTPDIMVEHQTGRTA